MNKSNKKFKLDLNQDLKKQPSNSIFEIKTANHWIDDAKNRPIPNMLFGEFWFEQELCILFADTNVGKSILAVQIGNSISSGISTMGLELEAPAQKVIYFDFELSDKQFESRYSNKYQNHFSFNDNFLRGEIQRSASIPKNDKSFEDNLLENLETSINIYDVKIIIIDNITYLKNGTEKSTEAISLMRLLNDLKKKYELSILVLAHTPKRDMSRPITKNDLSGSKTLMNFCDSSFAIGESYSDPKVRYLKQIKQRNVENVYGISNVITCSISKNQNFLQFNFDGYDNEMEFLKERPFKNNEDRNKEILELKKEGKSNVSIAKQFGMSEGNVRNILKKNNI